MFEGRPPVHPVLVALADTVRRFEIPAEPFLDLIAANVQDQRVAGYATWEELAGLLHALGRPGRPDGAPPLRGRRPPGGAPLRRRLHRAAARQLRPGRRRRPRQGAHLSDPIRAGPSRPSRRGGGHVRARPRSCSGPAASWSASPCRRGFASSSASTAEAARRSSRRSGATASGPTSAGRRSRPRPSCGWWHPRSPRAGGRSAGRGREVGATASDAGVRGGRDAESRDRARSPGWLAGRAERYCQRMARREAGNFYWGFIALPRTQRVSIYALYDFARQIDDATDGPGAAGRGGPARPPAPAAAPRPRRRPGRTTR